MKDQIRLQENHVGILGLLYAYWDMKTESFTKRVCVGKHMKNMS